MAASLTTLSFVFEPCPDLVLSCRQCFLRGWPGVETCTCKTRVARYETVNSTGIFIFEKVPAKVATRFVLIDLNQVAGEADLEVPCAQNPETVKLHPLSLPTARLLCLRQTPGSNPGVGSQRNFESKNCVASCAVSRSNSREFAAQTDGWASCRRSTVGQHPGNVWRIGIPHQTGKLTCPL